jgi:2-oxoisovalerate dehydrogenase E1 component alpha subunit
VVFFCQNNQWAISQPIESQTKVALYKRAAGFGFPGVRVDGNDVLAVLAVTRAALARARAGEGPTLIEAFTYRMGAHTTSDDPSRYRLAQELEEWKLKDPIERVKSYLTRNSLRRWRANSAAISSMRRILTSKRFSTTCMWSHIPFSKLRKRLT